MQSMLCTPGLQSGRTSIADATAEGAASMSQHSVPCMCDRALERHTVASSQPSLTWFEYMSNTMRSDGEVNKSGLDQGSVTDTWQILEGADG